MKKIIHKGIPVLYGEPAKRFEEKANENLKKIGSIDFSKESENTRKILKKSKLL
tara:strand:+ start:23695 stop:23856 length:162 start_codon:yes stop_codon:yes gene_type:complete